MSLIHLHTVVMSECTSCISVHECIITCICVGWEGEGGEGVEEASARTAAGTQNIHFNTPVFTICSVMCMLCCTASYLTQLMQLGLYLSLFLLLILYAQTLYSLAKQLKMFRKRVFWLSGHVTTEAKMTSEQKRGKKEKKSPLKQTNKANSGV